MSNDVCDVLAAVAPSDEFLDQGALARLEVHVDVRQPLAIRVQEPLKQQAVGNRVDLDDPHQV